MQKLDHYQMTCKMWKSGFLNSLQLLDVFEFHLEACTTKQD